MITFAADTLGVEVRILRTVVLVGAVRPFEVVVQPLLLLPAQVVLWVLKTWAFAGTTEAREAAIVRAARIGFDFMVDAGGVGLLEAIDV